MPKAFLFTNKRYDLYKLNIPRIWCRKEEVEPEPAAEPLCLRASGSGQSEPRKSGRREAAGWRLVIDENRQAGQWDDEQPVNLSTKKIDLFNLTQLAEVSLARAVSLESGSTGNSSASSSSSEEAGPCLVLNTAEIPAASVPPHLRHSCAECGKGFSTLSNLARHRQTHRSPTDTAAVKKCPQCDKVYVSVPAFSMHLRTHSQGCKCPYCGKGFSRPWLLQGHIRTHTGEKPFKCNICGKAFADKSNLRAHTQTHSTEKPFSCSRCGKTFALKSYLCKHVESSCMKSGRTDTVKTPNETSSSSGSEPPSTP